MDTEEPKVANLIWMLRLMAMLHVLVALAQAVTAGSFMEGNASALNIHQLTGTSVITTVAVLQVVLAVVCWRRHQIAVWFPLACLVLFFAEMAQIGLGFTDRMALHVPLGSLIVGMAMILLFASLKHFGPENHPEIA